jgi:hypothetical protein
MSAAKKKKAPAVKVKVPGVIATIVDTISRAKGASIDEIVEVLVKAFPDRDADGMKATTRIQSSLHLEGTGRETRSDLLQRR